MSRPNFGVFEPVFESAHGYLALLNLDADDASNAVELVRDCCGKAANPYRDIGRLLEDPNWRPHLVAAVAVIVSNHDGETVKRLWRRLDTGSWVTPQIGVALFLTDPEFQEQSRRRLEAGCPVDVSDLVSMTAVERHSAAGPAGPVHRSAKAAATLLHLVRPISPLPSWVERVRNSDAVRDLLAQDLDDSRDITERWLNRIREITRSPG